MAATYVKTNVVVKNKIRRYANRRQDEKNLKKSKNSLTLISEDDILIKMEPIAIFDA